MQMPNLSLVISSLKDSIKDFVAGHDSGDPEEFEELDFAHLQDGPRVNEDSDDEGARGVASASEEEVLAFASYLGIDACIISTAQHASPNVIGQSDPVRVQLARGAARGRRAHAERQRQAARRAAVRVGRTHPRRDGLHAQRRPQGLVAVVRVRTGARDVLRAACCDPPALLTRDQ